MWKQEEVEFQLLPKASYFPPRASVSSPVTMRTLSALSIKCDDAVDVESMEALSLGS